MKESIKKQLKKLIEHADERLLKILYSTAKIYISEEEHQDVEEELFRLVYISARDPLCSDEDIQQILAVSRRNNSPIGITGLLLHSDMRFLQILEGGKKDIKSTYQRIAKDPRHSDSKLVYFEPVKERYFSEWHMGSKSIENQQLQFDTAISDDQKQLYRSMLSGDRNSYSDQSMKALKTFVILT